MITLSILFVLIAVILFVVSALSTARPAKISLTDLGLAFFAASFLVGLI